MPAANLRTEQRPALRALCKTAQGVSALLDWIRTNNLPFALRSGGHSYEGFSQSTQVVIDLRLMNTIAVDAVNAPKAEGFYWAAITFSQTLGTALGDWMADTGGFGFGGGALVFAAGLAVIVALYFWTNISHVLLFWAAFILTRPLGATVGDFLDKPVDDWGLALSRPLASAVIAAFIIVCLLALPQRAGQHHARPEGALGQK